jgi:serine O-acetyltransferase
MTDRDRPNAAFDDNTLSRVVDRLCAASNGMGRRKELPESRRALPSRSALVGMVEDLRSVLFPGYYGDSDVSGESVRFHVGAVLDRVARVLHEQVRRGLCFDCREPDPSRCPQCEERAASLAHGFIARLPEVRRLLATDVQAHYEGDPAATSPDETILCYPGLLAITNHRLAHELYLLEVPLLPRIISEHAHGITGIDIHPGAGIGEKFFIDHGTGVVIGETCVIGDRVRIYQGVTLGAKSFPLDEEGRPIKGIPRHPLVEDDVIIYGGATILGRVTIGRGSVIGGNVWLTRDVAAGSKVTQQEVRQELFFQGGGI